MDPILFTGLGWLTGIGDTGGAGLPAYLDPGTTSSLMAALLGIGAGIAYGYQSIIAAVRSALSWCVRLVVPSGDEDQPSQSETTDDSRPGSRNAA